MWIAPPFCCVRRTQSAQSRRNHRSTGTMAPHQRSGRPSGSSPIPAFSRRAFVASIPLLLAGCVTSEYGSEQDGRFMVSAVDTTMLDPSLMRQEVAWHGREKPGTIVVKVSQRRLYLVEKG